MVVKFLDRSVQNAKGLPSFVEESLLLGLSERYRKLFSLLKKTSLIVRVLSKRFGEVSSEFILYRNDS
jgi:hypothetical protein